MVRLPLLGLFWGCLLTLVHPASTACKENQYSVNGRCCDLCRPGNKLVKECSEAAGTTCTSCGPDEFLGTWNRETHCHQHRYCDRNLGFRVLKKGTLETDTVCVCVEGRHCTSKDCESCVSHSPCAPGSGVKQMATKARDTVCEACPVGFFSNVSSAIDKCHPWTSCETQGLVELRAGTNVTDAVCGESGVFQDRTRTLLVIPIMLAVLCAVMVVAACVWMRRIKKPEKDMELKNFKVGKSLTQNPVEVDDTPPVQEVGCQPATQEDGKESRISVQERP